MNKKVGLRILRFKEGSSLLTTFNDGDWTKKVIDIRDILKMYDTSDVSKFAMFMSFSESGTYITIARPISGRGGDNIAAWIFIPNDIEIDGPTTVKLVQNVKDAISATTLNQELLKSVFSAEYPQCESADFIPSSNERAYAKRKVGFFPLKDLLGNKRYQPSYSSYNAVLIEDEDGLKIVDPKVADLTQEPLEETIVFCPPFDRDLERFKIKVFFNDGKNTPFDKPVRLKKNDNVRLIFKRAGFLPIPHMDTVNEKDQICSMPRHLTWEVKVGLDKFRVYPLVDNDKDITGKAIIEVNGKKFDSINSIVLTEAEAKNATVTVSVKGYSTETRNANLLAQGKVEVGMHRADREQHWQIELADGSYAEMIIKSKELPLNQSESPIRGYTRSGVEKKLDYTNFGVLKQRVIGFCIACVLFLIICICSAIYDWYDSHNFDWQFGWPPLKVEKAHSSTTTDEPTPITNDDQGVSESAPSLDQAIHYLDTNDKWQRDSLIKYSELDGLFEDLNQYNFDGLLKRENDLKGSNKFKELINVVRAHRYDAFSGSFCGDGDYEITISKYINKLNNTSNNNNNTGGVTADGANPTRQSNTQQTPTPKSNAQTKGNETSKSNENKFDPKNLN
jgi:hypothetical protein